MKLSLLLFFVASFGISCTLSGNNLSDSKPIKHDLFTQLLAKHVNSDGMVNYKGVIADSLLLNRYLAILEGAHPNEKNWSKDERLAYWINAYNAFTLRLIIRNYPVKSIKELGGSIYRVNTAWDIKFINIEEQKYHLNNLENTIIRKEFTEPRIHFALVCAAKSCPKLRNEAYTAEKLNAQLEDQAIHFFNSKLRNDISADNPKVSKLMDWYGGDFKVAAPTITDYINKYSKVKIREGAKLGYMDYDWTLNEQ